MLGSDGVVPGDIAYLQFDQELMELLRLWARERGVEEYLPTLMLLVAHLGQTGMAAADVFYHAGYRLGFREGVHDRTTWRRAKQETHPPLTQEACRHCRHSFRPRGWWRLRWGPWSCVFGLSPQGCRAFELPGAKYNREASCLLY
jgi:hypothetical protein